ncbi:hypothetical protein N7449_005062 [Penicillium cf. viridicatum]|uniref:Uncharacterized protein n=1 Tax=Penicillium cf. viridicatum TaxID=2972119 RepID=A0A9W9SYN5_9EURO|nr:hypothetical protein N7449_005062 [Penicillium cf. viridicatum]
MDHKLSQVSKRSNILDTDGHNGRRWPIHPRESWLYKLGFTIPTGSVAIEVVTSVAISLASLGASTLPLSVIKAESQDLPLLNEKKRAAESSALL